MFCDVEFLIALELTMEALLSGQKVSGAQLVSASPVLTEHPDQIVLHTC